jgi:UDPglucose 6-dehydrogenase
MGLAFKPNTDDMREAVSIRVINELLEEGANVVAYDPKAVVNARHVFGDRIEYASSSIECLKDAECCIVATEWEELKQLEPEVFIKHMKSPLVIDGRRIYDPQKFSRKLKFAAIGLSA